MVRKGVCPRCDMEPLGGITLWSHLYADHKQDLGLGDHFLDSVVAGKIDEVYGMWNLF